MPPSDDDATRREGPLERGSPITKTVVGPPGQHTETLPPGTVAGHWVLDQVMSSGGGGDVYLAHHQNLMRQVAVKVLLKDLKDQPTTVKRFIQEAVAVNLIRHPSIVDVFEFGTLPDGRPYLVMELLEGETLLQLIKRQGRLSPTEALEILTPLCDALDAAHRAGFVHRDVKAANVHLGVDRQGQRRVILLDFGIAKALRPDAPGAGMTSRGSRLGSVTSMAPEQITGSRITPRTDVYGLGALLFRMLTGRHAFLGESIFDTEHMHAEAPVPPVTDFAPVSPAWNQVVRVAMAKDAAARFASADDFLSASRLAHKPSTPPPATDSQSVLAVALYVSVQAAAHADTKAFDAVLDAFDFLEQELQRSRYSLIRVIGSHVLGAMLLGGKSADEIRTACTDAQTFAAQLISTLSQGMWSGMTVRAVVHVDLVNVSPGESNLELSGGALIEVHRWAPDTLPAGVVVTPEAQAALAGP